MDLSWPSITGDIVVILQRLFKTPLHVEASFDSDMDARALLQSCCPDMVPEEVANVAADLVAWREDNARSFKRARRGTVETAMYFSHVSLGGSVQDAFKHITQTDMLALVAAHSKRRQRVLKLEAENRSKRMDAERKKYSMLLAQVIIDANLPVAALIQTL